MHRRHINSPQNSLLPSSVPAPAPRGFGVPPRSNEAAKPTSPSAIAHSFSRITPDYDGSGARNEDQKDTGFLPKSAERSWPPGLLGRMERSFQRPLRNVRVFEHSWPEKHGADALATDSKLVFKPGLFPPRDAAGMELLGHEVAHVMQKGYVPEQTGTRPLVHANAALEAEAGRAGARAAQGLPASGLSSINVAALPSGTYPIQLGKKGLGQQKQKADEQKQKADEQKQKAKAAEEAQQKAHEAQVQLFRQENQEWHPFDDKILLRAEGSSEAAAAAPDPIVRDPKSYGEDRKAQGLRWMSTVLLEDLNIKKTKPVEVQTNLLNDKFTVAANMNRANKELVKLAGGNDTATNVLKGASQRLHAQENLPPRVGRHLQKLDRRLLGDNISSDYETLATALSNPFDVAAGGGEGLHAERRIKAQLGEDFGQGITKGTKRPCAACHTALYSDTEAHAGPLWTSGYATQDVEWAEIAKAPYTSATRIQHGENGKDYTFNYDTDSDSDSEPEDKEQKRTAR